MNKMKKKLMASIAMLVISTILMTSTSYAWYTINTKAEAGDIEVTLAQTQNVEIAKADVLKLEMPVEVTAKDNESQMNFGGAITYETSTSAYLDLPAKKFADGDEAIATESSPNFLTPTADDNRSNKYMLSTCYLHQLLCMTKMEEQWVLLRHLQQLMKIAS